MAQNRHRYTRRNRENRKTTQKLTPHLRAAILQAQQNEITEWHVYNRLAKRQRKTHNKKILQEIANDELRHYKFWKNFTNTDISPSRRKIIYHTLVAKLLGLTFAIRLMEKGEDIAQKHYKELLKLDPKIQSIIDDEEKHEQEVIDVIDEKALQYVGSIVLGLNDALVELTGALAGLTLALQDTQLIATVGLITGIAASLSMAASEYLSQKEEETEAALRSSIYTGIAYVITVIILIAPYFIVQSPFNALGLTLSFGVIVILAFTFYTSVAKNVSFPKKFLRMVGISLGMAIINFFIGYLVRKYIADV